MKIVQTIAIIALLAGSTVCSRAESPAPVAAQPDATSLAAKAQGLIDKAKTLAADKKYQEAAKILKNLAVTKLTPEQKKTVDSLTAQVQKALAGQAASDTTKKASDSVGGLLGK